MPEIKLKGQVQQLDKVVKNEKDKISNFFLTINTNQQYKDGDPNIENDIAVFEETLKGILSNINDYVKIQGGEWSDENIKDVDIDYVIELGTVKKCIHAHIMLKFKHNTHLMLDYVKIKAKILNSLGLKNIYINNKVMKRDSTTNVLDYINKFTKKL
jgi:hypothetical protein